VFASERIELGGQKSAADMLSAENRSKGFLPFCRQNVGGTLFSRAAGKNFS
jgi:hypothetical protein